MPTDEDLEILSRKLMSLKLAYEQYFLGSRPREPVMAADEVKKLVVVYSNEAAVLLPIYWGVKPSRERLESPIQGNWCSAESYGGAELCPQMKSWRFSAAS